MGVDAEKLGRSARTVADAGAFVERAAHAVKPSSSVVGRVMAVLTVVKLGSRLLPEGRRLLRRYPVGSLLVVAGLLGALYLTRAPRAPARQRPG